MDDPAVRTSLIATANLGQVLIPAAVQRILDQPH
jgi:hypothetical protein